MTDVVIRSLMNCPQFSIALEHVKNEKYFYKKRSFLEDMARLYAKFLYEFDPTQDGLDLHVMINASLLDLSVSTSIGNLDLFLFVLLDTLVDGFEKNEAVYTSVIGYIFDNQRLKSFKKLQGLIHIQRNLDHSITRLKKLTFIEYSERYPLSATGMIYRFVAGQSDQHPDLHLNKFEIEKIVQSTSQKFSEQRTYAVLSNQVTKFDTEAEGMSVLQELVNEFFKKFEEKRDLKNLNSIRSKQVKEKTNPFITGEILLAINRGDTFITNETASYF